MMSSDPTLLDLLAVQSDNDLDTTLPDPVPSGTLSGSSPSGNLHVSRSKRKSTLSRQSTEPKCFSSARTGDYDGRSTKRLKVDQSVSSCDESIATSKAIYQLLTTSNDDASTEAFNAIERLYSPEDSGEKIDR